MEPLAKPPHLHRRGAVFWYRRKVPKDLHQHFGGRREVTFSLATKDRREALSKLALEDVRWNEKFDTARRRANAEAVTSLSETEARQMVLAWFWDGERRSDAEPIVEPEELLDGARTDLAVLTDPEDPNTLASVQSTIGQMLAERGIALEPSERSYRFIFELVRRASIEQARRRIARVSGQFGATFDPLFGGVHGGQSPSENAPTGLTLQGLVDEYLDEPHNRAVTGKTRIGREAMFRLLLGVLGRNTPVSQVTRQDARRVRDVLMVIPPNSIKRWPDLSPEQVAVIAQRKGLPALSATSANSYLSNFVGLFRHAVREHGLGANPFEDLRVVKPKVRARDRRRSFTPGELQKIFDAPLYRGCRDDEHGYAKPGPIVVRRGRFWVPLIALYSGMRLEEICQLDCADISERDGVPCLLIRESDEKSVKTEAAERIVPVHPELRRIGLLAHAEEMRRAGEVKLFPELPASSRGSRAEVFSKWFSRFLHQVAVKTDKTVTFHSFRHSFRDALREAGVSRDAVLALGGWSGGGTEEIYGSGLRPKTLAREIAKARYPGLDLSHLQERF